MVRLRLALIALVLAATAVASSSRLSDAGGFPHKLKIVAFGSSSTQGIGASTPAASYPAQLEAMLRAELSGDTRVDVINRGIGGEDIDDMMLRLDRDVLRAKPDIVVWQTGSNDVLRGVPLERFAAKTRAGLAAFRKAGIVVVLMEPQWCPKLDAIGAVTGYRDIIRRVGAETGIPVVRRADLMHAWIDKGRLAMADMLSPDGLHMRDAGYRLLAAAVAGEVLHLEAAPTRSTRVARL